MIVLHVQYMVVLPVVDPHKDQHKLHVSVHALCDWDLVYQKDGKQRGEEVDGSKNGSGSVAGDLNGTEDGG